MDFIELLDRQREYAAEAFFAIENMIKILG